MRNVGVGAVRLALASVLAVTLLSPGAAAAPDDHRREIDLTFPTIPSAAFSDDYDVGRGPGRAHQATDLFADAGTPVHAARGGTVTWVTEHRSAGWAVHVRGDDGRTYAYYHLGPDGGDRSEAIAAGIEQGVSVSRGQRLGSIGDSGNAAGSPPHLHFEIHDDGVTDPYGRNRINPVASLRAALDRGDVPSRSSAPALLRLGSRGADVEAWQRELDVHSPESIAVDGVYGEQTWRATLALQQREGVVADGVVGPQTRAVSAAALTPPHNLEVLRVGAQGRRVAEWQQQLDRALPTATRVDGWFGPGTEAATRELQRSRGIVVDGIVGPQTRQAMATALR